LKKKNKLKVKPKKVASPGNSRNKEYLASLDLRDWWEEFAHGFKKNGAQKYPTVWSFIKAKAKVKWQQNFLYWLLGPKADEGKSEYGGYPQYDWADKRARGFWYSSENIERLSSTIKSKDTAFARLQTAGESLLDDLSEVAELQKQITREFGHQLLLPDNTADENASRVKLYLELKSSLQQQKAQILNTFAKTQGMDLNQLTDFLQLFAGGMGAAASAQLGYGGGSKTLEGRTGAATENKVLLQLTEQVMRKAAMFELDLPDMDAEQTIKEMAIGKIQPKIVGIGGD
jgi:hypothetical protein